MLLILQILPIFIYIFVIIFTSNRYKKSITIYKKTISDAINELNNKTKKIVHLTQQNYLLKKKCEFLEKELYPNVKKVKFSIDDILNEINDFGYENLSEEKKLFLQNYKDEKN